MKIEQCWYSKSCNRYPDGCDSGCIRFLEMTSLVEQSNLPKYRWYPIKLLAGKDKNTFQELAYIKENILKWVQDGSNLYLYSTSFGNGKTSWAIKLMLSYFDKIWAGNGFTRRAIFISVPEFLDRNREVIGNRDEEFFKLRHDLLSCDLVIWDDIASVKLTDYNHSMLLNYLDARMLSSLSNIFTGNANFSLMQKLLGGRLASRVWNSSEILEFKDGDKRGTIV